MALYRGETRIGGIGNATTYVTQAEYDLLPSTKLTNNVNYGIYEGDTGEEAVTKFIKNGESYAVESNTKTFYISGSGNAQEVLAEAQEVYNWYKAGKNPIVILGGTCYTGVDWYYTSSLSLVMLGIRTEAGGGSACIQYLYLWRSGDTITNVQTTTQYMDGRYLSKSNTSSYTPSGDYNPATKKYVDDAISSAQASGSTAPSSPTEGMLWYDTTNDVLKVYDGSDWNEVGSGGGGERPTSIATHSNSSSSTNDTYIIPYDGIIVASGDVVQNGSTGYYNSGCTVSVGGRTIYTCYKSNYDAYKRESGPKMMTCRAGETLTATLGSQGGSWSYTYFSY